MTTGLVLTILFGAIWAGPRRTGRLLWKIHAGYLAQKKDEGHG